LTYKNFYIFFILILSLNLYANEYDDTDYIKLSPSEENFLKNTNIKAITSVTWAPINMRGEKDELTGIAVDFWNLIKRRAHIQSTTKIAKDWNEVINSIEDRSADITLGTSFDQDKLNYAYFSSSYISFPIAFATLYDKRFIPDGSFLEGKKVAVGENYSSYNIMKHAYPKIDFVLVKNTSEALKLLSAGKVEAVIDILPVIAHLISKNGYYNLKISGTSEHKVNITFMVRNDYKDLLNIINKHIAQLTPEDKNHIIKEWLTVKFDKRFIDYEYLIQFLILLALIILFYTFKQKDLKKYNEQLKYLSTTDTLTGLYNRRKIDEILNEIKNKKYSLIILDIDKFKDINDVHGHLVGDKVLIRLAQLLRSNINVNDEIGRWGGEEFLIICKNTSEDEASVMAQRLRNIFERENFNIDRKVTASFGICEAKKEFTLKDILAQADMALYRAKQEGRNQVIKASQL
jgi:diguanylate cyclase (GGDEF)-like protein